MLTPNQMSHMEIAIHKNAIPALLSEIPKYQIHIVEFSEPVEKKPHRLRREYQLHEDTDMIDHKLNEIEEFLSFYFQKMKINPKKIPIPSAGLRFQLSVNSIDEAIDKIHNMVENEIHQLKGYFSDQLKYEKELQENKLIMKIIQWLSDYNANTITFEWFDQLQFRLFYIGSKEFTDLEVVLEHEEIPVIMEFVDIETAITAFFIIYHKSHTAEISKICQGATEIQQVQQYFTDKGMNINRLEEEIQFASQRLESTQKALEETKSYTLKYRGVMELIENCRKYNKLEAQFRETYRNEIVRLEAYVPTVRQSEIINMLDMKFHNQIRIAIQPVQRASEKITGIEPTLTVIGTEAEEYNYSTILSPSTDQKVPSLIEPKKWYKPFRLITQLYGTTNYAEIDPTPIVALTYPILFGLMFGDVGHGIILFIVGLLLILSHLRRKSSSLYDAGFLLVWLGIASMIGGLLYGEIFGYGLKAVFGQKFPFERLFVDPLLEMMTVLKFVMLVGVGHLCISWFMAMLNHFHNQRAYLAFADPFCKILVLLGGTYVIFTYKFNISAWFSPLSFPPYPVLLPILPAIFLLLLKPFGKVLKIPYLKHESIGKLVGEQTVEVTETFLGILSNVVSYSRLLALAMAHLGLILVITTLADLLGKSIILSSLILIIGNLLVIIIETLMAAIQALRLTFYEFFGKFYLADGIPYDYIKIASDYSVMEFEVS